MRTCNNCLEAEGIHPWGRYRLCDECHKLMSETMKSKKEDPDIQVSPTSNLMSGGYYDHSDSTINLIKTIHKMEHVLSHETMHHVLNRFISPQVSYNYDNISGEAELEKEFIMVLSKV